MTTEAVGRFLLQVRQPGTRCQTISAIRRLAKTLLVEDILVCAVLEHVAH